MMIARGLSAQLLIVAFVACAPAEDLEGGEEDAQRDEAAATSDDAPTYQRWAQIIRDAGGEVHPSGWATVLGIRGLSKDGVKHETESQKAFDDLVIILEPGTKKVHRLAASTHPWERRGEHGIPDVSGDGAPDVGMIRPGKYIAKGRGSSRPVGGLPAFDVKTNNGAGQLPGWRDVDHDGRFTAAERASSESRKDVLTAVLFHRGGGTAPPAVGCQVFDEPEMNELITAVGGSSASFNYLLVDAATLDIATLPR